MTHLEKIDATLIFLLALILGALTILFMVPAEREEVAELSLYCEMVEIRVATGDPYLGWPDYKGIYDTECIK